MIDDEMPQSITCEEAEEAFKTLNIYIGTTGYGPKCCGVATYPSSLADDLFRKVAKNRKPRFEVGAAYCAHGHISSGIYQRRTNGWQLYSADGAVLYFDDDSELVIDVWLDSLVKLVPEVTDSE